MTPRIRLLKRDRFASDIARQIPRHNRRAEPNHAIGLLLAGGTLRIIRRDQTVLNTVLATLFWRVGDAAIDALLFLFP
nr:hypothetical protein [Paraburkholderia sp. BL8N3]